TWLDRAHRCETAECDWRGGETALSPERALRGLSRAEKKGPWGKPGFPHEGRPASAGRAVLALVREVAVAAEDAVGEPLPGLRARERVEEDPKRDPGQEQRRVAAAVVLLLALDAPGGAAQLLDRRAQLGLELLVRGNARGDGRDVPLGDQLVVDRARRV